MRIICLLTIILVSLSCTNNVEEMTPCNVSGPITYFTHVYPIIDRTCSIPGCHVYGFENGNFKNESEVKRVADNGKLAFMIDTRQMPPGSTSGPAYLTNCEIKTIKEWIEAGAPLQ